MAHSFVRSRNPRFLARASSLQKAARWRAERPCKVTIASSSRGDWAAFTCHLIVELIEHYFARLLEQCLLKALVESARLSCPVLFGLRAVVHWPPPSLGCVSPKRAPPGRAKGLMWRVEPPPS